MKFSSIKIYQHIREKERKEKRKRMISWGEGLIWGVVAIIFLSQAWSIFGPEEPVKNYSFTFLHKKSNTPEEAINLDSIRSILDTIVESKPRTTDHTERMTDFLTESSVDNKSLIAGAKMTSVKPKKKDRITSRGENRNSSAPESLEETPPSDSAREEKPIIEIRAPSYVGGKEALNAFIYKKLNYPQLAKDNNIEGKVVLKLWIEIDGKIAQIGILQSLGYGCDQEAVRVVQSMPAWIPGEKKGEKRGMWVYVPFIFSQKRAK